MALYSAWLLRRFCRKESRNALVVVSGFLVKRYCLPTEPEDVFTGLVGTPVSDLLEPIGAGVQQTLRQLSLTRRIVRCVLGRGRLKLAQVNLFMKLHQIRVDVVDGIQASQLCVQSLTTVTDPRSLTSSCTQSIAFLPKSSQIARIPQCLSKPGGAHFSLDTDSLRKNPEYMSVQIYHVFTKLVRCG